MRSGRAARSPITDRRTDSSKCRTTPTSPMRSCRAKGWVGSKRLCWSERGQRCTRVALLGKAAVVSEPWDLCSVGEHGAGAGSMTEDPEQWQLVRGAPELYERHLVPAVTLPWALDLVDRVGVGPGDACWILRAGWGWLHGPPPCASIAPGGSLRWMSTPECLRSRGRWCRHAAGRSSWARAARLRFRSMTASFRSYCVSSARLGGKPEQGVGP